MRSFSSWYPLTRAGVDEHAPDEPAAIQIRRADGLIEYPDGRSAMVCYLHASSSVRASLEKHFADELDAPGSRGQGELEFRLYDGDDSLNYLRERLFGFEKNFDALPLFNQKE